MTEVHDILGGGFECHVIATHTHRKSPPWPLTSKAASREVEQLLDERDEFQIGESIALQPVYPAIYASWSYNTIRFVLHIAQRDRPRILHVHQLSCFK